MFLRVSTHNYCATISSLPATPFTLTQCPSLRFLVRVCAPSILSKWTRRRLGRKLPPPAGRRPPNAQKWFWVLWWHYTAGDPDLHATQGQKTSNACTWDTWFPCDLRQSVPQNSCIHLHVPDSCFFNIAGVADSAAVLPLFLKAG